jgi:hypothetical protein
MSALAHGARAVRLPRAPWPTWGAAFTAAFLGWLASFFVVGLAAAVTNEAGLNGFRAGSVTGHGLRDWPYPATGDGSTLANGVVWLAVLTLTALVIRGALADRSRKPISAFAVFAVVAVTGFAPFVPRGILDLPWPVELVLTAALLRLTSGTVAPLSKRATTRLLLAGAPLLVVPAVYGALHPLWFDQVIVQTTDPPPPRTEPATLSFGVFNAGHAAVDIRSVSLEGPGSPVRIVDVVAAREPPVPPPFGQSPRLPIAVEGRGRVFIQLRLLPVGCPRQRAHVVPVEGKSVIRYSLFGRPHTARLAHELLLPRCR